MEAGVTKVMISLTMWLKEARGYEHTQCTAAHLCDVAIKFPEIHIYSDAEEDSHRQLDREVGEEDVEAPSLDRCHNGPGLLCWAKRAGHCLVQHDELLKRKGNNGPTAFHECTNDFRAE